MIRRFELQRLRERALEEANCPGINLQWKRAYEAFADAADRLDAMVARCTVEEQKPTATYALTASWACGSPGLVMG